MEHSTEFTFARLTAERLERAAALCDACVGKIYIRVAILPTSCTGRTTTFGCC